MRLRYWIRSGLQTFAAVLGACAFYAVLMYIQLDDGLGDVLTLMPLYFLVFGAMMLLAMNIGVYKSNLPLALSFGSTRNEAILGLNLFRLIPAVLQTLLVALLCALGGSESLLSTGQAVPVGLGVYLVGGALGTVVGVVYTKYGKVATVITTVLLVLIGLTAGILAALSDVGGIFSGITISGGLPWLVLTIGLFLYSLSMIPEQRTVWKCNVKL